MGRALTKRHSSLFSKKVRAPFLFVRDIYQYGKARELCSFLVWELRHRLGLFPAAQYLTFVNDDPLTLGDPARHDNGVADTLTRSLDCSEVSVTRSQQDWRVLFLHNGSLYGSLPHDPLSLFTSSSHKNSLVRLYTFPERIKAVFVTRRNTILVCVKGAVYRSDDAGSTFRKCLELGSTESFFRHNNGITETPDNQLVIAEYGNVWNSTRWKKLAYLYFSTDDGRSWERSDFLITQGTNKHVHLVKYSTLLNRLFVTDGDNNKRLWASPPLDAGNWRCLETWTRVTRSHIQTGGYTSVVETDRELLFGSDYQGGTNFLVSTNDARTYDKRIVPDPYRRSPIDNMVQRRSKNGVEVWANLPYCTPNTKCLLMFADASGGRWRKVIEYTRRTHKVSLISSSREIANDLYFAVEDVQRKHRAVYKVCDA